MTSAKRCIGLFVLWVLLAHPFSHAFSGARHAHAPSPSASGSQADCPLCAPVALTVPPIPLTQLSVRIADIPEWEPEALCQAPAPASRGRSPPV